MPLDPAIERAIQQRPNVAPVATPQTPHQRRQSTINLQQINTGEGQPGGLQAEAQGKIDNFFNALNLGGGGGGGGSSGAQRSLAREKLAFDRKTGLRDIKQAREAGLKKAINNALQRGIFNSGIRLENESLVNREADEAKSDLNTRIDFALKGVNLSQSGGGGSSGLTGLSPADMVDLANKAFKGPSIPPPPPPVRTPTGVPPPIVKGRPS